MEMNSQSMQGFINYRPGFIEKIRSSEKERVRMDNIVELFEFDSSNRNIFKVAKVFFKDFNEFKEFSFEPFKQVRDNVTMLNNVSDKINLYTAILPEEIFEKEEAFFKDTRINISKRQVNAFNYINKVAFMTGSVDADNGLMVKVVTKVFKEKYPEFNYTAGGDLILTVSGVPVYERQYLGKYEVYFLYYRNYPNEGFLLQIFDTFKCDSIES